ncbi:unnamed protein product, partial [Lymnaea stagnalis]
MVSKALQAQRFVQIINQQLDVLKEERNTVTDALDECINQVQSEVDAWVNEGHVNQETCAEISHRIQQVISLFIEKSVELSAKQIDAKESDLYQTCLTTINNLTSPGAKSKVDRAKTETLPGNVVGSDNSNIMTMRIARLEEAVDSLKKTTEKVEDKIENVDKILKGVSSQQVNDHKKMEILTNVDFKSEKKLKDKITDLEKRYQDINSKVDDLFETVTYVDDKLNKLEDENKPVNVSVNEINKQISSVRTCSNDALMSIQDLSKRVESTNQHYNEMSDKMNQLEIS